MAHALVLGATGGIGGAVARRLAPGHDLTLSGREAAALGALARELDARAVPADLASELEVAALFEGLPPLDVLVYAAGAARRAPLAELRAADAQAMLDANLLGLAYTLRHARPRLAAGARIVVVGARPELAEAPGMALYAASKAAVAALVAVARRELRGAATLTLVLPAAVDTPLWDGVAPVPRGALRPAEVADAVAAALEGAPQEVVRVG